MGGIFEVLFWYFALGEFWDRFGCILGYFLDLLEIFFNVLMGTFLGCFWAFLGLTLVISVLFRNIFGVFLWHFKVFCVYFLCIFNLFLGYFCGICGVFVASC